MENSNTITTEEVSDLIRPTTHICPHCGEICRSKPHLDVHTSSCESKPTNPVGRPPLPPKTQTPPPILPPTPQGKPLDRMLDKLIDKDK